MSTSQSGTSEIVATPLLDELLRRTTAYFDKYTVEITTRALKADNTDYVVIDHLRAVQAAWLTFLQNANEAELDELRAELDTAAPVYNVPGLDWGHRYGALGVEVLSWILTEFERDDERAAASSRRYDHVGDESWLRDQVTAGRSVDAASLQV